MRYARALRLGWVGGLIAAVCWGQAPEELKSGRRVLERAAVALKDVKGAEYDVEAYAGPQRMPDMFRIVGRTTLGERVDRGLPRFRITGAISPRPEEGKPRLSKDLDIAYDQIQFTAANATDKAYIATSKAVELGSITDMMAVAIAQELCKPAPFSDELQGSVDLVGSEAVGADDCYVVNVLYQAGGMTVKYWIAKSDLLIRKIVREADDPTGRIVGTTILSNLKLNPTLKEDGFRVAQPAGYADARELAARAAASQPAASKPADPGK